MWRALNQNQDRALRLLGDHETAAVGNKTEVTDDADLVIHSETALVLLHFEFIEREEDRVRITRDGLVKIGKVTESRAERKAKAMARSLRRSARASGCPPLLVSPPQQSATGSKTGAGEHRSTPTSPPPARNSAESESGFEPPKNGATTMRSPLPSRRSSVRRSA